MVHYWALVVFLGILALAAAAADIDQALRNRYRPLEDHADAGLGADEYRGPRRYTRPTDMTKDPDHRTAKHGSESNDQNTYQENQS